MMVIRITNDMTFLANYLKKHTKTSKPQNPKTPKPQNPPPLMNGKLKIYMINYFFVLIYIYSIVSLFQSNCFYHFLLNNFYSLKTKLCFPSPYNHVHFLASPSGVAAGAAAGFGAGAAGASVLGLREDSTPPVLQRHLASLEFHVFGSFLGQDQVQVAHPLTKGQSPSVNFGQGSPQAKSAAGIGPLGAGGVLAD